MSQRNNVYSLILKQLQADGHTAAAELLSKVENIDLSKLDKQVDINQLTSALNNNNNNGKPVSKRARENNDDESISSRKKSSKIEPSPFGNANDVIRLVGGIISEYFPSWRLNKFATVNSTWFKVFSSIMCNKFHFKSRVYQHHKPTRFTEVDDVSILPRNATDIIFTRNFDASVDELENFPNLTHIVFKHHFNQLIDKLPPNLTHLTLGDNFNQPIDNLPKKLKSLTLTGSFNQRLDNLPQKLETLQLSYHFDHPVDNLPKSLTELYTGARFNRTTQQLPPNLRKLTFGRDFNQSADNLPENLEILTFGEQFDKPVDNLPESLLELKFGDAFNQTVEKLPNNLRVLKFGRFFDQGVSDLPDTVTTLILGQQFSHRIHEFPPNLVELMFDFDGIFREEIDESILPASLRKLAFPKEHQQELRIPANLTHLYLGFHEPEDIPAFLYPETIKVIGFGNNNLGLRFLFDAFINPRTKGSFPDLECIFYDGSIVDIAQNVVYFVDEDAFFTGPWIGNDDYI